MANERITNKELYTFMSKCDVDSAVLHEKIDAQIEISKKILAQTVKTNGRVDRLEGWRDFVVGAVAVLTTIVLPLAFMVIQSVI